MTITVELLDSNRSVIVDDRTAELGGSFWLNPHLMPYSPLPLRWCFDRLLIYPKVTLLDIGASTGCFSLLSKWHGDMTVHAFEPVDLTYRVLCENVYLNGLEDKVHTYRMGISDYNGTGTLHTVIADGGKGVSIVDGNAAYHKVVENSPIKVMTVDSFCDMHNVIPTFIKIDTEGNEKAVLRGAAETIQRHHPFILCEYSAENADQFEGGVSDIIVMLEKWGYTWTNPEGIDLWAVHKNWETEIS